MVIFHVYTWYIHSIFWVFSAPCGWCCRGGQGPIPPDPPAITSPGLVITLILLHSRAHFGFLLWCMWIRRARLELKIARKCRAWQARHTNRSSSKPPSFCSPKTCQWQEQIMQLLKEKEAGTDNELSFQEYTRYMLVYTWYIPNTWTWTSGWIRPQPLPTCLL